jgi:hypothetical protein
MMHRLGLSPIRTSEVGPWILSESTLRRDVDGRSSEALEEIEKILLSNK